MTTKARKEKLESARVDLVKSFPIHLSLVEKKQLRTFIDGVMNLRHDEVAAGHDLYLALLEANDGPYPSNSYTGLLQSVRNVFYSRSIASLYRNDPEGFREWHDYVGSEHERTSSEDELEKAFADYSRFGPAEKWDWAITKFRVSLMEYWGVEETSFESALEQTLQVLCFPVFTEKVANPILERWSNFSDNFRPMVYTPRTLEERHLTRMYEDEVFY